MKLQIMAMSAMLMATVTLHGACTTEPCPRPAEIEVQTNPESLPQEVPEPSPGTTLDPAVDPAEPVMERPAAAPATGISVDTETETVPLSWSGPSSATLEGRLADVTGRRQIVLTEDGHSYTLFDTDWNLPGQGSISEDGRALVCANVLLGDAGDHVPELAAGAALRCRFRDAAGQWSPAVRLAPESTAAWLVEVTEADGVLSVRYRTDANATLIGPAAEGDAIYDVQWSNGEAAAPVLVAELVAE